MIEMWEWCALVRGWIGTLTQRTGAEPDQPIHPQPASSITIKDSYAAVIAPPEPSPIGDRPVPPPRDGAYHATCRLLGYDVRPAPRRTEH